MCVLPRPPSSNNVGGLVKSALQRRLADTARLNLSHYLYWPLRDRRGRASGVANLADCPAYKFRYVRQIRMRVCLSAGRPAGGQLSSRKKTYVRSGQICFSSSKRSQSRQGGNETREMGSKKAASASALWFWRGEMAKVGYEPRFILHFLKSFC